MRRRGRSGFGLVEILVAMVCFTIAMIPILNLYSLSIDGAKLIHARSIMYSGAQELLSRCVLVHPAALPPGQFQIPAGASNGAGLPSFLASITAMPTTISRTVTISQPDPLDPDGKSVTITLQHAELPQLDITWSRYFIRDRGGRYGP